MFNHCKRERVGGAGAVRLEFNFVGREFCASSENISSHWLYNFFFAVVVVFFYKEVGEEEERGARKKVRNGGLCARPAGGRGRFTSTISKVLTRNEGTEE